MGLIEWRDEFRTGFDGVDYEHEDLIGQINAVFALIENQADKRRVVDSLDDIYGNIAAHFALEEQLMRRRNYDQYDNHRADHERLLDEIREITEHFEYTDSVDAAAFGKTLADWFEQHFKTHDARLHGLAARGVQEAPNRSTLKNMIQNAKKKFLPR